MNWSKGYTSTVYVKEVDPVTWRDLDRIEITGGSISRGDGDLMEAASVDCVNYDQTTERWIRIWMDTTQEGAAGHVALFTGLATSPDRDINGRIFNCPVSCYSVLKPAADVLLPRGWYAQAGVNGANLIADLLSVTPAPKDVADGSPTLSTAYIAESGESRLTMTQKILAAIDWRIRITGDGTIHIEPKPTEAAAAFSALENDVIEPELSVSFDWYECPNVLRVTSNGLTAVARDETAIEKRGREIWAEEDAGVLGTEPLQDYAVRRLKELEQVSQTVTYDRRHHPDVLVGSLVQLNYPEQGLSGIYKVISQDIDLTAGGRTTEEVEFLEV